MSASKSPSLRRIQADVRELALDPSDRYHAAPLEHDMFEWHFTIRGADKTDFEGGIYHGRILLPPEYPFKPPHIVFLTPSGRFETHQKVCLSFSAYHPELWQPAWGIRLILEALISFLPTPADGAIGALDWTSAERKRLAKRSVDFCCPSCGPIKDLLPKPEDVKEVKDKQTNKKSSLRFAKEIEELQRLQQITEGARKKSPEADVKSEEVKAAEGGEVGDSDPKPDDEAVEPKEKETSASEVTAQGTPQETDVTADDEGNVEEESTKENPEVAASSPATVIDSSRASGVPTETPPRAEARNAPVAAEEAAPNAAAVAPASDPSWMIDPLLNLMVALMAVICYLLFQKCGALWNELQELQTMEATEEAVKEAMDLQ